MGFTWFCERVVSVVVVCWIEVKSPFVALLRMYSIETAWCRSYRICTFEYLGKTPGYLPYPSRSGKTSNTKFGYALSNTYWVQSITWALPRYPIQNLDGSRTIANFLPEYRVLRPVLLADNVKSVKGRFFQLSRRFTPQERARRILTPRNTMQHPLERVPSHLCVFSVAVVFL